ncbi:WD40-repeat-containing domain protein [Syncephalastrum racemosum]|uniref:WD40-repeat-containing domain protein n=1 Tax=Syncephalastrum racemosum TaxID=13706 RepID=A0A1X2H777_SYNRA|nr:WD40-repeat-containing domain protein [Syncephalastrum racemosum]
MTIAYKLETSLFAHSADVRAVSALSDDLVVSAGRDKTVRSWRRVGPHEFTLEHVFQGHDHYVNALATIPPSSSHPNGLIVSSGSDKLINVYDPAQPDSPLYTLVGHTENVCALATTPAGHIVSGSWDKKVIVWKDFQQAYALEGHSAAVWAVLAVDDDTIITGAADKTIRIWHSGKPVNVLQGHQDAVRGLALIPGTGFVSCSNDSTLRVWTLDGNCIQTLDGHTSFVYTVSVMPSGEFVSAGEDRTVRVWKDGQLIQTIQQPCVSVWAVSPLPNSDIVVGGSDNAVRVFTRADERAADAETQKQFDELVASQAIPANQVGDVNKEKLAGPEALQQPGKKEGQVIMINAGSTVEAHQWSAATQSWQKIGDVVGGVGSGSKTLFEGKEYDYVFDIDIGNGPGGMLKLPFNVTDNPYDAAQKFIWRHELPQMYLDEIANFITKNAQGVELGQSTQQYQDPFTGAGRYVPGQQSSAAAASSQFMDPYTGNVRVSRYLEVTNKPHIGAGGYHGAAHAAPSNRTAPATPSNKILPLTTYLSLKQASLDPLLNKLTSLNGEAGAAALSEAELGQLGALIQYLKNPSQGSADVAGVSAAVKIASAWPSNRRFPALDVLRLVALYAPQTLANVQPVSFFIEVAGLGQAQDKVAETNAMLAYRGLANLLHTADGRQLCAPDKARLAQALQPDVAVYTGKPARLAIVTLAVK